MSRVAILIDGDNIPSGHAGRIVALGQDAGRTDVRRVYADATRANGWTREPTVVLNHAGTGKNAADLLLSIDAMDLAHTAEFATFVVASSDGDFSHLATRLRERGHTVIGCGEAKTPEGFRAACSRFEELPPVRPEPGCRVGNGPTVSALDHSIQAIIKRNSQNGSGIRLADLNPHMRREIPDFKASTLPGGTWRAYLTAHPALYDLDPRGVDARIRLRPARFQA